MSTLTYILLFTLMGSIGALVGGFILLAREKFAVRISHFLASFAAGVLLGAAFFDLLPEAVNEAEETGTNVFLWTFLGIILFFLIERFIRWFHHHHEFEHEEESKTTIPLIIFGDSAHNFIDGVVIAATFMVSIPLGVVTAIAVAAHEIPQEVGDFGLLLHKGLAKGKIIVVNLLSAAVAIGGAVGTYLLGDVLTGKLAIFLAATAGFFIYIAASDLIPEIHYERRRGFAAVESILLLVGAVVIFASVSLLEAGR